MAVTGRPVRTLTMWELRWICGPAEGIRYIPAPDEESAITELQDNAGWYGIPCQHPLVVIARAVRRIEGTL